MSVTLTPRDIDLLETLTLRVRILCIEQLLAIYWPGYPASHAARRRVESLVRTGWIQRHVISTHPAIAVERPLFRWVPGQRGPDVATIVHAAQARWSSPARLAEVFVASPRTACMIGSIARRLPPPEHRERELHVGTIYSHYRTQTPELAAFWVGKHGLPKPGYGQRVPDALLRDSGGRILHIIQSAGRYGTAQVSRFHDYCESNDLSYELW